jgi:hypothetical protein
MNPSTNGLFSARPARTRARWPARSSAR